MQELVFVRIFKVKPPIGPEEYEWLVACFAWLRKVLDDGHIRPELILPDDPRLVEARTATDLFDVVRECAGMSEWPCQLERVEVREEIPELGLLDEVGACGTFSFENGSAVIRYADSMLRRPDALVATFAHELCHYLLANAGDPPGGPDLMEHSTDCAAVYLGFGTFLANSARDFSQFSDSGFHGWRSSTQGYLSEQSLVTATALFASLHGYAPGPIQSSLKRYLQKDFGKAVKAVAQDFDDLSAALAGIDLLSWKYA